ncbi:hypothetical protein EWB00_006768 [Schistosoma japonicum]|uniref:Uncharacterized protein n=1 Tax=Schistosoma japonicum TaxID=6182 RepID=A0A4Z2CX14_SCHJA|nr:hypothetical protein EWB00_006768 [Schistosoma japonicum]
MAALFYSTSAECMQPSTVFRYKTLFYLLFISSYRPVNIVSCWQTLSVNVYIIIIVIVCSINIDMYVTYRPAYI